MTATQTQPKYLSVADAIEVMLRRGAWDGRKMPSVRGIALQHNVSVVTASRALQVLRDKGLIQTIERSGCYRIPPPTADRWALCLRTAPGPWQLHTVTLARSGFESLARRMPMLLQTEAFEYGADLTLDEARRAATAAKGDEVKGVFLLPSRSGEAETLADETFMAGCDQAKLPVVLLERALRARPDTSGRDLVSVDDLSATRECTEYLIGLGRRKIGVVVASSVSSHNDRVAGYLFALHQAKQGNQPAYKPTVIYQKMNLTSKEAYAAVTDEVIREGLDAILCYQDYTAMGVILELMQRRVRVPEDVAVIGFDNLPIGDAFNLALTTYDYPTESVAEHAVLMMRDRILNPERSPVRVLVPGRLIVRGSTEASQ